MGATFNDRYYSGPNCAGHPRESVPEWLDHTANNQDTAVAAEAPHGDPGPNAVGVVSEPISRTS